jgi:hypothetical protein
MARRDVAIGMAAWLLIGVAAMIGSFGSPLFLSDGYAYDRPPKYDGRELTPAEKEALYDAIDSIQTPPPDSITYTDAAGNQRKVSCFDLGYTLFSQVATGRVEAETKAKESTVNHVSDGPSTSGDEMNVDPVIIGEAISNPAVGQPWLQETLIHEGTHKTQTVAGANRDSLEIEALSAAMAYKLASGVAQNSTLYQWEDSVRRRHARNYFNWLDSWRVMNSVNEDTVIPPARPILWYIKNDPQGAGGDFFTSFRPDTSDTSSFHDWSFGVTRAADFMIIPDHYLLPPGHALAVVCGSVPAFGLGRVIGLDLFQGQVMATFSAHDFGPPTLPPMSFYSMTHSPGTPWYYLMDTLNQQIEVLRDSDLDSIPDEFIRVFAAAVWPPFAELSGRRGIEVADHPIWGRGICAYLQDRRESDVIDPYDSCLFLKDANGDQMADWCEMMSLYQFISFKPCIMDPPPWPGDVMVPVFATWNHTIQVWASDSTGEVLTELLGNVLMSGGVHAECALMRELEAGEFIIANDPDGDRRLSLATRVIDPVPRELTVSYDPEGFLVLRWESVPRADHYRVYSSANGVDFFDTGLAPGENEIALPLPPTPRQFYRVTAEK